MLEDATDRRADAQMLLARLPAEIHTIEHERAQGQHCAADLVALRDVARLCGRLDEIVDERVDAARPGRAEDRDLVRRQVVGREHAGTNRVIDVVVDVGNAIDDAEEVMIDRVRQCPESPLAGEHNGCAKGAGDRHREHVPGRIESVYQFDPVPAGTVTVTGVQLEPTIESSAALT